MNNTNEILIALRGQAWERAKGELRSIGHASFTGLPIDDPNNKYEKFFNLMNQFIESVESYGLIE